MSWQEPPEVVGAGDHHGRAAVERYVVTMVEEVGTFRTTVEGIDERSGEVLAYLRLHATLSPSGVPGDYRLVHVHRLRDGVVDRIRA